MIREDNCVPLCRTFEIQVDALAAVPGIGERIAEMVRWAVEEARRTYDHVA